MIDPKRWYWCGLCDTQAIVCEECKNSSCNGGGCPACDADFKEVSRLFAEDSPEVPTYELLAAEGRVKEFKS